MVETGRSAGLRSEERWVFSVGFALDRLTLGSKPRPCLGADFFSGRALGGDECPLLQKGLSRENMADRSPLQKRRNGNLKPGIATLCVPLNVTFETSFS